jgi:hypothetical protein
MSQAEFTPDLSQKIAQIEREVDSLRSAISRARMVRFVFLLALIALVLAVVYFFLQLASQVTSEKFMEEIASEAKLHIENNQNDYQKQVQSLVDHSYPILTQAFSDQATKDMQKFTSAMDHERETLTNNLQTQLNDRLSKKYQGVLQEYESKMIETFPELADEKTRDKVIDNFQSIIKTLVARNYGDRFNLSSQRLMSIWDEFPAAEEVVGDATTLEEKLVHNLMQVATEVMSIIQRENEPMQPTPVTVGVSNPNQTAAEPSVSGQPTPEAPSKEVPSEESPVPSDSESSPPALPAETPASTSPEVKPNDTPGAETTPEPTK